MLIPGMPDADYRAHPAISKSKLDWINRSPQHFQHFSLHAPEETNAMRIGRATHCAMLEPVVFANSYCCAPKCDRRTKEGKATYAMFEAENKGKSIISEEEYLQICSISLAFRNNDLTRGVLAAGAEHKEASLFWKHPIYDLDGKCRVDLLHVKGGTVYDIKTTDDASPAAFRYSAKKWRYHVQGAYYIDGVNHALGKGTVNSFVLLVVEKEPPHAIAVYLFDDETIEEGRLQYEMNLATYANCLETNTWPGYSQQVMELNLGKDYRL